MDYAEKLLEPTIFFSLTQTGSCESPKPTSGNRDIRDKQPQIRATARK